MNATSTAQKRKDPALIYSINAMLLTMFLFFIDEGYYDFRWMRQPGNWIVFVIYFTGLLAGQVLAGALLAKFFPGFSRVVHAILGLVLGFGLVLCFLYGIRFLTGL